MRLFSGVVTLLFPLSCALFGQSWEVGASAGYGLYRNVSVTSPSGSGKAGFESGIAAGALLGQDLYRFIGGEIRYTYRRDDLKVSSGGTKATLGGDSHALHYDVLFHLAPREAKVRPYLAAGAGVKFYRGTGAEPVYQPLWNTVVLTHTNQAEPLISLGAGLKFPVGRGGLLRLDFRDYATPYPEKLLALPGGSKAGGWMHDFVAMVGLSRTF